jgi:hypothetical protein
MILRAWRGRASQPNQDAYPAHFRNNVLPELHASPNSWAPASASDK